ncbi:hypothetical protein HYH02_011080 [Chlamydomonas schloesseri]|uniref:Uncharacterized protein n=1 Tax=Chlamydomonas schloesseri TaxID=2026947 RepID=A0A835T643_9CHLO|nr:hypothetical protein HYH02_011080 [Chlamydomonas schloesseri]|eukprot:KAG2437702.1 hypothetical protein HYH02_011080 [Chlamydomonas schloesseri]
MYPPLPPDVRLAPQRYATGGRERPLSSSLGPFGVGYCTYTDTDTLSILFTTAPTSPGLIANTEAVVPYVLVDYDEHERLVAVNLSLVTHHTPCHLYDTLHVLAGKQPLVVTWQYYDDHNSGGGGRARDSCWPPGALVVFLTPEVAGQQGVHGGGYEAAAAAAAAQTGAAAAAWGAGRARAMPAAPAGLRLQPTAEPRVSLAVGEDGLWRAVVVFNAAESLSYSRHQGR